MRFSLLCLALATFSSMAQASIKIVEQHEQKAALADGLSLQFIEMKKDIVAPQVPDVTYHATDTRFVYSTPTLGDIEKYGVVQFIRGCQYESRLENGKVVKALSVTRDYFGKQAVQFVHPHWQIDNDNADPLYSSYEGASRFALLRWNDNPASLDADNAHYYQSKKPSIPKVFVTDLPGAGSYDGKYKVAKNMSLEFKTCIFKIADLPLQTTPDGDGVDQKKALWCVSWDHKYVWNFSKSQMMRPKALDPICGVTE